MTDAQQPTIPPTRGQTVRTNAAEAAGGLTVNLDVLGNLTSFYVRAVNIAVSRDLDLALSGLPVARGTGKISTLLMVDANPGIRPSLIARMTLRDRSAMVRLLDQMKDAGLLTQRVSATERRSHELHLTDKGRALAREVRRIVDEQNAAFFDTLSPQEMETLNGILSRVYARVVGEGVKTIARPVGEDAGTDLNGERA